MYNFSPNHLRGAAVGVSSTTLPLSMTHPEYQLQAEEWAMLSDVYAGERAIKAAGKRYLPALPSMADEGEAYREYRDGGTVLPVIAQTIPHLAGTALRYAPEVDGLDGIPSGALREAGHGGEDIRTVAYAVAVSLLLYGRGAILCDADPQGGTAYLVPISAPDIIDWQYHRRAGRSVLTRAVLAETSAQRTTGGAYVYGTTLRELFLDDDGLYEVRVYRPSPQGGATSLTSEPEVFRPVIRGERLTYIPLSIVSLGTRPDVCPTPPMAALARLTLAHYRTAPSVPTSLRHSDGCRLVSSTEGKPSDDQGCAYICS